MQRVTKIVRSLIAGLVAIGGLLPSTALAALPESPRAEPEAKPQVRVHDYALANWLLPTRRANRFIWYFAMASRVQRAGAKKGRNLAAIGKGRCIRQSRRPGALVMCDASRFVKGKAKKNFRMGPLAANGSLVIRRHGRKHVARWSADVTKSSVGRSLEDCRGGHAAGAGTGREATPTGKLFGRRLRPKRHTIVRGFLYRNISASACSPLRSIEIGPESISLRIRFR